MLRLASSRTKSKERLCLENSFPLAHLLNNFLFVCLSIVPFPILPAWLSLILLQIFLLFKPPLRPEARSPLLHVSHQTQRVRLLSLNVKRQSRHVEFYQTKTTAISPNVGDTHTRTLCRRFSPSIGTINKMADARGVRFACVKCCWNEFFFCLQINTAADYRHLWFMDRQVLHTPRLLGPPSHTARHTEDLHLVICFQCLACYAS